MLQYCFCSTFWFSGHEACGILAPQPGIEPAPPVLEGEVLTTGPSGKSPSVTSCPLFLSQIFLNKKNKLVNNWSRSCAGHVLFSHRSTLYTLHPISEWLTSQTSLVYQKASLTFGILFCLGFFVLSYLIRV